ncbi:hypothetical protein DLM_2113 [Aquitalea magnusonii]|uniref:Uncharacterized protein n=1 Tax=Aquitalea magnusonii TaxID=332411 RepID=A0A3G9GD06_9NEIS|nr:hypothetical protein DLM_2113 [Aquitalea magnusonii]
MRQFQRVVCRGTAAAESAAISHGHFLAIEWAGHRGQNSQHLRGDRIGLPCIFAS